MQAGLSKGTSCLQATGSRLWSSSCRRQMEQSAQQRHPTMQTLSQAEGRMYLGLPATSPSLVHKPATQIHSLEQEVTCLGPPWTLIQACAFWDSGGPLPVITRMWHDTDCHGMLMLCSHQCTAEHCMCFLECCLGVVSSCAVLDCLACKRRD